MNIFFAVSKPLVYKHPIEKQKRRRRDVLYNAKSSLAGIVPEIYKLYVVEKGAK